MGIDLERTKSMMQLGNYNPRIEPGRVQNLAEHHSGGGLDRNTSSDVPLWRWQCWLLIGWTLCADERITGILLQWWVTGKRVYLRIWNFDMMIMLLCCDIITCLRILMYHNPFITCDIENLWYLLFWLYIACHMHCVSQNPGPPWK